MANKTANATGKRERKNIIEIDRYNRYELDAGTGVLGELYVPMDDDDMAASATITVTVTALGPK